MNHDACGEVMCVCVSRTCNLHTHLRRPTSDVKFSWLGVGARLRKHTRGTFHATEPLVQPSHTQSQTIGCAHTHVVVKPFHVTQPYASRRSPTRSDADRRSPTQSDAARRSLTQPDASRRSRRATQCREAAEQAPSHPQSLRGKGLGRDHAGFRYEPAVR